MSSAARSALICGDGDGSHSFARNDLYLMVVRHKLINFLDLLLLSSWSWCGDFLQKIKSKVFGCPTKCLRLIEIVSQNEPHLRRHAKRILISAQTCSFLSLALCWYCQTFRHFEDRQRRSTRRRVENGKVVLLHKSCTFSSSSYDAPSPPVQI